MDDGSEGHSYEKLKSLLSDNFFYYKIKNSERGFARNYGAKKTRGLYVNFFDSDDICFENHVSSFKDFVVYIWGHSFDNPEYFNAWHVGQLAEDIEYCLENTLNYCAILPRFHFKSTVLGHAFSVCSLLKSPRDCAVLYLSYSDAMAR